MTAVLASVFRVAALLVAAYLLLCVGVVLFQRKLQYFPAKGPVRVPPDEMYGDVRPVRIEAADGTTLEAWWWPAAEDVAILHLHGNAGHRGGRLDWMTSFHHLGWPVLLLDYRGYGGSGGHPTEAGLVADAEAALDWLRSNGHERVVLFGESLGCGVAGLLASRREVAGLVLQSGAISIAEVAQRAYPFLPMRRLLFDRYDLEDVAPEIHAPSLSVHGDLDRLIDVDLGRRLHDALGGPKAWYTVEGAGHNDVPSTGGLAYVERVHAFLEEVASN